MRETRIGVVQSPLQADLDRIAEDVIAFLGVDVALISVLHNNALVSLGVSSTVLQICKDRTHAPSDMVCLHVMKKNVPFQITDATAHPETSSIGYVRAGLVGGYIGVPIQNAEVGSIGAICGVTRAPRTWKDDDLRYLKALSSTVENLILREMYRRECADASTLATEYDNIIAAFSLVRAEATSIHDAEGRLVFANRALTQHVDDTILESEPVIRAFRTQDPGKTLSLRLPDKRQYLVSCEMTASGYWVCQWKADGRQLN
jgi:GAF domain-containing protein